MDDQQDNSPATLTEALHARIRQDIILGELPPASKLKLEPLSRTYGVSVNTLRETLSRLASDGLVVAEGQRGFAVLPVSMEDLRDITQMRAMLECHALELAIGRADLDWESRVAGAYHKLSRLERLVEEDPETHGEAWEKANQAFHNALISNCGSRWLMFFHRAMYDQSLRYRMLSLEQANFPRAQSAREHKIIFEAALARDAETAVETLRAHILKGAERTRLPEEAARPAARPRPKR